MKNLALCLLPFFVAVDTLRYVSQAQSYITVVNNIVDHGNLLPAESTANPIQPLLLTPELPTIHTQMRKLMMPLWSTPEATWGSTESGNACVLSRNDNSVNLASGGLMCNTLK